MKSVSLVLVLFFFQLCQAQDVTGIWRGSFNSSERVLEMFNMENKYKFEVQLEQLDNNAINGVTYSYKTTVFYGKATADGSISKKTGDITLREIKTVEVRMSQNSYACIMTCHLKYSKNGDDEFLEGTYESYGERDSSFCGKGTVFLQKVSTSDFHKEPFLVKRSIQKQQEEMLAANSTNNKKITPGKNSTRTVPPKPGTGKTAPAKPDVAKNDPAKSGPAKNSPSKPDVAKKNPPASVPKKDSTAVVRNTTPKPKIPVKKPEVAAATPRPSENGSIPDLAKADTPETKRMAPVIIPKVLANRQNELVKTISLSSREVVINIYDNGTIDHDTVSVYLDKKLVVLKQMLTTAPITIKFTLGDDNEDHELVLVAENMGDIPPNTSLMVVKAGDQTMEVRITSTEQKNAVVAFRYKKPA